MQDTDKALVEEAAKYGLKASQYLLLPPNLRQEALRKDIARAKERMRLKNG